MKDLTVLLEDRPGELSRPSFRNHQEQAGKGQRGAPG
jgi:hypothetical protein